MLKAVIADDEGTIRRGMEKMIESFSIGIEVAASASDGREALKLIMEHRPEIIVTDINMPHINGLDMIRQTEEIVPNSRVIIISGYDDFAYAQSAMRMKVFDYLLKPVKAVQLRETLVHAAADYIKRMEELERLHPAAPAKGDLVTQLLYYLKLNYENQELCLQMAAEQFFASPSYLSRSIKQKTGMGFSDYLNSLRLGEARRLLVERPDLSMNEISRQTGFSSQHYFCRVFKNAEGISPSDYRNEERSK